MIVDDFDVLRSCTRPAKADSPLVVDADRMLSRPVVFQSLKTVGRWDPQCAKRRRGMQHPELATCDRKYVGRKAFRALPVKHRFRHPVLEALDQRPALRPRW